MLTQINDGLAVDFEMVSAINTTVNGVVAYIDGKEIPLIGMTFKDAYEMINRYKEEEVEKTTSTSQWAG